MVDGPLSIDVVPAGSRVVLRLSGELDLASIPSLRVCVDQLDRGWRSVVLDLGELTFMDSSGVALIVRTHARFEREGRLLQLVDPQPPVERVLALTGVTELVPVLRQPTTATSSVA